MDNSAEEVAPEFSLKLPRWLEDLLPEQIEPQTLSTLVVGGKRKLRLTQPDGSHQDFDSLRDADSAQHSSGLDLSIEQAVYDHFSDGILLGYPSETPGSITILISYTDERRRKALESAYHHFLEVWEAYSKDPSDFLGAYRFIDSHPAFWTAFDLEQHPWHWETQGYCSKLRQFVWEAKDGGYRIGLEGGGHVEIATDISARPYSEHYGDWRLESKGSSFEEAILDFAARLILSYDSEGNSLSESGFPYPVPEWVEDLKRIDAEEL